mmetsp:Transcript_36635/g.110051  ORF Transcript_36635/g.110051 Transcript_36635/m.110051 type:complete len:92 (+) Transcript_36635:710-985(+)
MIDGYVDARIPEKVREKVRETIAKLHLSDFDPTFNDEADRSPCIQGAFEMFTDWFDDILSDKSPGNVRADKYASEIGKGNLYSWMWELKRC